jgi:hypothetical protein
MYCDKIPQSIERMTYFFKTHNDTILNARFRDHYDHISIELMAYRTYWESGEIDLKDHDDFKWVSSEQLTEFDFAPADRVFVEKLQNGEIAIQPQS